MKNKRSIEELLNSIYMLISEAKNEYESTLKIDNNSLKEIEKEVFLLINQLKYPMIAKR